jgi:hypothetical protein
MTFEKAWRALAPAAHSEVEAVAEFVEAANLTASNSTLNGDIFIAR